MGRFIRLQGVNSEFPSVDVLDPILPEQGALFLTETAHPVNPWSGLENPTSMPNIATAQTLALLGEPVASAGINYSFADTSFGGTDYGLAERSEKGGLHVIFTERDYNLIQGGKGAWADLPQQIEDYFWSEASKYHRLYVSLWTQTTRASEASGQTNWHTSFGQSVSITAKYWFGFPAYGTVPASTGMVTPFEGRYGDALGALGPRRRSIGQEKGDHVAWSGSPQGYAFNFGTGGTANGYQSARNRVGSNVFYRIYIEDMTVSGRTYAEVDAIDAAMFAKAFGPGGRYYGDTWTDPATIP